MAVLVVHVLKMDGPDAVAVFEGREFACVIGRTGAIAADEKREGDSKTPLGRWPLVAGFYRPDRVAAAGVCQQELEKDMGWCDAAGDVLYNAPCEVGYAASHEVLWHENDAAYDYIGIMDHNLDGKVAANGVGMGSAIFLHVWDQKDYTAGCVALKKADLEAVLAGGCDCVEVVPA